MKGSVKTILRHRAHFCCEYCCAQEEYSHDPFSAEHINPVGEGGDDDLENLAWACLGCNFLKHDFTTAVDLLTGTIVRLFNPRKDKWTDHFEWNEDFTLMIGLTPIGRATIKRLDLNRQGLVNYRKILVAAGKHPPQI
jgi:hypothetical protein